MPTNHLDSTRDDDPAPKSRKQRAELDQASPLAHVEVILVEPRGPRNVGACARAMCNFALPHLCLVNGPPPDHPEALETSVKGHGLLRRARTVGTLDEALAGTTFVVGTTARRRSRLPTLSPRDAAPQILAEAARGKVALLFGREDHGLSSEEIATAHLVIGIETSPSCRALNLGQAVLIVAYELFGASEQGGIVAHSDAGKLLTGDMIGHLERELLGALTSIGILHPGNAIPCEQTIRRLLALGPMQTRDARLLFALARRVQECSWTPRVEKT